MFRFRPFNLLFALSFPLVLAALAYWLLHGNERTNLFVLLAFAFVGTLLSYEWLWGVAGTEELEITAAKLIQRRRLLGFVRTRTYKVAEMSVPRFDVRPGPKGAVRTSIAFTYSGREIRLCESIQASEVNDMMAAVLRHLPELNSTWGHYVEAAPSSSSKGYTVLNLK